MKGSKTVAVLSTVVLLVCIVAVVAVVAYLAVKKREDAKKEGKKGENGGNGGIPGDSCQKGPWSYRSPKKCAEDECDYIAEWEFDADTDIIDFKIRAKQGRDKWTGIGFSRDKSMVNTDVIIARVDITELTDTNQKVMDGWISAKSSPFPIVEKTQDVLNPEITYDDGVINLSFQRKRPGSPMKGTSMAEDLPFADDACLYFIYPVGGGRYTETDIEHHGSTPKVSSTQICIRATCPDTGGGEPEVDDPRVQPTVFSPGTLHAAYLWMHVKDSADAKECAKLAADLQHVIEHVNDGEPESDMVMAGVGFGEDFYNKLGLSAPENYTYPDRSGELGDLPSTGGDIFIHAKSNKRGNAFESVQHMVRMLDEEYCLESFEDIYSFVYKDGRDLSGFIDGTENPSSAENRYKVAVEKSTGGSYVITQKWEHKMDLITHLTNGISKNISVMEGWVGRKYDDSKELKDKSDTSHVARMTGGTAFKKPKRSEIVRQSMPFGSFKDMLGLHFIAYSENPDHFEFMLKRMVGETEDELPDDIMKLSECKKGTYWYFPSMDVLKGLREN